CSMYGSVYPPHACALVGFVVNTYEGGNLSPLVPAYPWNASPSCFRLLEHFIRAAASRTFWTAGSSSPIRIAMIAITTNNSIRVKPDLRASRMVALLRIVVSGEYPCALELGRRTRY